MRLGATRCDRCAHRTLDAPVAGPVRGTCRAFPLGIPMAVWTGAHDHRHPFPGDGGLRFLARPGPDASEPDASGPDRPDLAPRPLRSFPRGLLDGDGPVPVEPEVEHDPESDRFVARWPGAGAEVALRLHAGEVTVWRLGLGDQPSTIAGWLVGTAARHATEGRAAPSRLRLWVAGDLPDDLEVGAALADAADVLGLVVAELEPETDDGGRLGDMPVVVAHLEVWEGPPW